MSLFGDTVTVELFLDDAWVDITEYVRVDPGIDIKVGQQSESGTADANTATLVVNNRDGRFSPRNTAGAYYPDLKRNTPLRVAVDSVVRFTGEVAEFPSRWDASGRDVWAPLVAAGIMRRLTHASQLDSTMRTVLLSMYENYGVISGYWPIEDDPGSTQIASALPGGTPGVITGGSPNFAAVDPGVGSFPVATWGGAKANFTPDVSVSSTEFACGAYCVFPESGLSGGEELFRVEVDGSARSWRVLYSPASGGGVFVQCISSDGTTELLASSSVTGVDGRATYVTIDGNNTGANVDWVLGVDGIGFTSGTINTATVGEPLSASIGSGTIAIPAAADMAIGHLAMGNSDEVFFHAEFTGGFTAFAGESGTVRLQRMEDITGMSITIIPTVTDNGALGPQPDGTLLEIMRDIEKAQAYGILYDTIEEVGVSYISRTARYNDRQPVLVLDYAGGDLSPPLEPTDDDQQLRNDVKVNRVGGSSARATLTGGALSVLDYPDGAGPYPFEDSYGINEDTRLPYLADWILALGTIDETRFPAVTVDLVANPALVGDAEDLRPGARLRIENLPAYAGATDVDLQVIGWSEHLDAAARRITFVCTPGTIWGVAGDGIFELDDATFGELDVNRLAY